MGHRPSARAGLALAAAIWVLYANPASAQSDRNSTGSMLFDNLPDTASNTTGAGYLWRFRAAPVATALPLEDLHVVLMASGDPPPSGQRVITVAGYSSRPPTIAVTPGTKLTFVSGGPVPWMLEVIGRAMPPIVLDAPGARETVVLDKPGRYEFRDRNSTSVTTYVIVGSVIADSALERMSDVEAEFDFGAVPPGTYRFRVYFRGENVSKLEREVTVGADGALKPAKTLLTGSDLASVGR